MRNGRAGREVLAEAFFQEYSGQREFRWKPIFVWRRERPRERSRNEASPSNFLGVDSRSALFNRPQSAPIVDVIRALRIVYRTRRMPRDFTSLRAEILCSLLARLGAGPLWRSTRVRNFRVKLIGKSHGPIGRDACLPEHSGFRATTVRWEKSRTGHARVPPRRGRTRRWLGRGSDTRKDTRIRYTSPKDCVQSFD